MITIHTLTTKWVVLAQPVITFLADIATHAFDIDLAAALPSNHPHVQVSVAVTYTTLQ